MKQGPPHECPVGDCQLQVAHHLLMCASHWRMVPFSLRRAVDRTWNLGRGYATPEHREACRNAVDHVNWAQGNTDAVNPFADPAPSSEAAP
jgi:hypothetical protein